MSKHNFNRNFAVIIGINSYQNSIRELITAVPDALKLAEIIQKQHENLKPQYQAQNKYEVQLFLNQRASLSQLKQLIADFKQGQITLDREKVTVTESDRLLFYFAGHGIALDALENQEGPVGYLIPQDAISGDSSTYLTMQELHDALNALPCRHLLAILDCCFAGAFRWASVKREVVRKVQIYKERYDRFISDRAWQVITSASDDQKALDFLGSRGRVTDGNEVHSPFAQALFDVLLGKGGDSNQDGMVTATELYSYLRDQVEIASENYYQRQTPSLCPLRKHDKGEFIFLLPDFDRDKLEDAPPLNVENNPYRGLSSYDEKDSSLFFGREEQIQKLYQKVVDNKQQLTLVLGASGTGKSSLVKAGLIPKFRKDDKTWRILPPFRPGESPLKSLNNVLESVKQPLIQAGTSSRLFTPAEESLGNWFKNNPQAKLLVVIDQFEELITLSKSEEAEKFQIFIKNILAKYPNNIHVVITLRLDFEAHFQTSVLKDFWNDDARFVVSPMSQNEFREAIEKPASQKVLYFDPPRLVDELINEVVQMPGALPLLSFTLSELYLKYLGDRTRDNRALTKKDYEELGRVVGSLTKRANQEYDRLVKENPAYQDTVRRVMLRMVSLQGGELARRQVHKSELVYPSQEESDRVQTVIKRFSEARLIVEGSNSEGEPYVEPAHDALVCGWDKLLAWKKENEENIILQRRLTPDAEEWKSIKGKFQPLGLQTKAKTAIDWFDLRLYTIENSLTKIPAQIARLWRRTQNQQKHSREKPVQFLWDTNPYLDVVATEFSCNDNWLNQVETEFVQESVLQKRRNLSWQWRIAGAVTLIISVAAVIAFIQWINAQKQLVSTIGSLTNTSQELFESNKEFDALLTSLNAGTQKKRLTFRADDHLDIRIKDALQNAVLWVKEQNRLEGHLASANSVSFSPNRRVLASGSADGTIKLWDVTTGKNTNTLPGHQSSVNSVSFSADGQILASGSADGTIKLWDVTTGKNTTLTGHKFSVNSVSFSADGQILASGSADGTIKLWDVTTGKNTTLTGHKFSVNSVSFSADGQILASGSADQTIGIWDVATGMGMFYPFSREMSWGSIDSVSFSPNGKTLAFAGEDQTIKLLDVDQKKIIKLSAAHNGRIKSVIFSHNGQTLASASWDNTIKLWDVTTGREIDTLPGHHQFINSVSFSLDDQILASASEDLTIKIWNIHIRPEVNPLIAHDNEIWSISFSPDGKLLASGSKDRTINIWNVATSKIKNSHQADHFIRSVSFNPKDENVIAFATFTKITFWNFVTNEKIHIDTHHNNLTTNISFSPNGNLIAESNWDKNIYLWDVATKTIITTLTGHTDKVNNVSFSPDGRLLASGSEDKNIIFWDAATGDKINIFTGHTAGVRSVIFSPNGSLLASGSADGTIKLWDVAKGTLKLTLKGHTGTVFSVSFSPDGRLLASGSVDKNIIFWDVATGEKITTLKRHTGEVSNVSFSPNANELLASGSADKKVILWNYREILSKFTLDALLARGCDHVRDYLQNNPNVNEGDRHLCDDVPPITTKPEN
ncbi:caspase family protein [Nostoc sphaeroides]|uniref:Peptidase C14 caspase domain-containing protein n=1 Tax=Nostoc sphaeroides CCNUC1 TaxID=2653204 RepID=A0A5P8WA82_9NOSO|nr:caspase family protein [Nostoc sphaeroides]QFS49590.1 hypothetical protein GXM_07084 [Nostoc sphaeroides CCNUC1]